jgi:hypothetical protein
VVTADDIRALVHSDLDDPQLILLRGEVQVVSGADVIDGGSALVIGTLAEIQQTHGLGTAPDQSQLQTIAALFDTRVTELGG